MTEPNQTSLRKRLLLLYPLPHLWPHITKNLRNLGHKPWFRGYLFFSLGFASLCNLSYLPPILDVFLHTAGSGEDDEHKRNVDIFLTTQDCKGSKSIVLIMLSRKSSEKIWLAIFVYVPIHKPVIMVRDNKVLCLTKFGSFAYLVD